MRCRFVLSIVLVATVLPAQFRSGADLEAPGDLVGEIRAFLAAGMDGFFTDNPDLGVIAAS
jgi:glycerophosphoryl diester phosphodiesterase